MVIDPDEVAAHGPYDVVLELVGAASLPTVLPHLAIGARVVVIGVGSGATHGAQPAPAHGGRGPASAGATLRARTRREKADVAAGRDGPRAAPPRRRAASACPVCATFPMAEADAAYDRFAAGGKLGKVVLVA